MNKPILVIMAAGMGSRYGGLKQMDPVGPNGEIIIDYSIYDAKKAGFETVIFIIKKEIEKDFKDIVGKRIEKVMNVKYAYQSTDDLPKGYTKPESRIAPWGTAHAVCTARNLIDAPFAVINADDYYGANAFKIIYEYLCKPLPKTPYPFCMVAYELGNTLTENGYVSRGVCQTNEADFLTQVTERTHIEKGGKLGAKFTQDNGVVWNDLALDTPVSMNLWGFTQEFVSDAWDGFSTFLDNALVENPLKGEYYLPSVVTRLIKEEKAQVKVLKSQDKWYGITYKEDKPKVVGAFKDLHENNIYPEKLF